MGSAALHMIVLVAATEAADAAQSAGTSAPDLPIFAIIIFALMGAILLKFAWGPIRLALDDREHNLATKLDDARKANEEAARLLKEQEAKLAGTKAEVEQLIASAQQNADSQKQAILAEAQRAADAEKERAIREIGAAKNNALQELADRSVGTAVDLAGRIVGKQLTKSDHANLIEEALKQFTNKN